MTDEQRALAGEFVLGTLGSAEREEAERLFRSNPDFAAEVRMWRRRLDPLNAGVAPVTPPPELWARIEARMGGTASASAAAPSGNVVELRRKVGIWRTATIAVTALAAALALTLFLGPQLRGTTPEQYVAVLDSPEGPTSIVVEVNAATGVVTAYSVAAIAPPDRSLELWYIGDGQAPLALGLLDAVGARIEIATANIPDFSPSGAIFAVTDEPRGGSPTGDPTGPVVLAGGLVRAM
ncbi:MAG: anti-sigma factor [Bauldia sp.]|nr:anti-sigma factor [Bauldia sp.]